jgi:hypothetical protein
MKSLCYGRIFLQKAQSVHAPICVAQGWQTFGRQGNSRKEVIGARSAGETAEGDEPLYSSASLAHP